MSNPPSLNSGSKRHSRHVSSNRAPLARRLTKGPLEAEDPPAAEDPLTVGTATTEAVNTPIPTTPFSPERPFAEVIAPPPPPSIKDYSYLLRPEIYHPLSQLDLPPPFRTPHHQPAASQPLPDLLANHHLRSAATSAALRLCTPPAPPSAEIFSLLYTRLACLTLVNHLPFAVEEAKALQDINSSFYRDEATGMNVLPWELRVLTTRLQGIGYGDDKKGVGAYYDLGREARAEIQKAQDLKEKQLWKARLQDLGLCVTNALIEMGDLGAAARQLESLRGKDSADETLNARLALLYLHLGDTDAARRYLSASDTSQNPTLQPLLRMAEGRYATAVDEWRALLMTHPKSPDLATQNLAVCLFYLGQVDETLRLLDGLVEKGRSFHALIFNLATVYELCSERGREKKGELAGRVAGSIEVGRGGERGVVDFKL